ncbi:MAG: LPXTG cell wall anchor domain-containing protein [bacterium]|jgi:LPXTG-motif cell wall-anchored protein
MAGLFKSEERQDATGNAGILLHTGSQLCDPATPPLPKTGNAAVFLLFGLAFAGIGLAIRQRRKLISREGRQIAREATER